MKFKHQANGIWIDKNDFKNNNDLVGFLNICEKKFIGYKNFGQQKNVHGFECTFYPFRKI